MKYEDARELTEAELAAAKKRLKRGKDLIPPGKILGDEVREIVARGLTGPEFLDAVDQLRRSYRERDLGPSQRSNLNEDIKNKSEAIK